LIQLTLKAFEQQKFSVATNRPYKGTLVPSEYYKKNKSVWSIMIEVNRKWYMNEETGEKNILFEETQNRISNALQVFFSSRQ
jgi:N-formylglutamate amidohydrolase